MARKKTTEQFKEEIYNIFANEYEVLGEYKGAKTKVLVKHRTCNNKYEVEASSFLQGSRCSYCFGSRKKTTEMFKQEIFELVGNEYEVIDEYTNDATKITIKHNICGHENKVVPNSFLRGHRCPSCYGNKKKNTKQFKQEVFNLVNNEYEVLSEYKNSTTKVLIRHNKCSNEYSVTPSNFLRGKRCPYCAGCMKKTTEQFKEKVLDLVGNEYEVVDNYISTNDKITLKHNFCENKYKVTPSNFIKGKRCPYCFGNMKKTQEQFVNEVFDLVGDEYSVLGDYVNVETKISMKHSVCGNIYNVKPSHFIRGNRCPKCSNSKQFSNAEKELLDYITSILPNAEILSNVRNIISPKELDIYIPSLNIAFEYNGLYWHTEEYIDKNYHLDKTNECNKKGIKLIHIFEDEWLNNQKLMKNKIANILGVNNNNRVYARKCYVKEIEDNSDLTYGLYAKDNKSLSTLTLCKAKKDGVYELLNYESNHNEVDDLDIILKYIKSNNQDVNKIYTYADLRFTDRNDNIYLKNGFKFVSQSKPNYWYVVNGERKEKVNKDSYYKIYDCGKLKYEIDMK